MGNLVGTRDKAVIIINLSADTYSQSDSLQRGKIHCIIINGFRTGDEALVLRMSKQVRKFKEEVGGCIIDKAVVIIGEALAESTMTTRIKRIEKFLNSNGIRNIQIREAEGMVIRPESPLLQRLTKVDDDSTEELVQDYVIDNLLLEFSSLTLQTDKEDYHIS